MQAIDRDVISLLVMQQFIAAVEGSRWDEVSMVLYKLDTVGEQQLFAGLSADDDCDMSVFAA
jgi:hypothetical protein